MKDRWTYRGTIKTRCSSCLGVCYWTEDAWVCDRCGDEWYPSHGDEYAPPEPEGDEL